MHSNVLCCVGLQPHLRLPESYPLQAMELSPINALFKLYIREWLWCRLHTKLISCHGSNTPWAVSHTARALTTISKLKSYHAAINSNYKALLLDNWPCFQLLTFLFLQRWASDLQYGSRNVPTGADVMLRMASSLYHFGPGEPSVGQLVMWTFTGIWREE